MKTEEDDALVEAILSLWDINNKGQIMKKKEISFQYDMNFKPSISSQMRLQLSEDKELISLPLVDNYSNVKMMAWKTKSLEVHPISLGVAKAIARPPEGQLKLMNFVGKSEYILQMVKQKIEYGDDPDNKKFKCYYLSLIFNATSGQKLFEFSNESKD